MKKIRKNDEVVILVGKNRGKRGVVGGWVDENRVTLVGVNTVKKAVKPNPMKGVVGGIVDVPGSIHESNVALFNPVTGKADRVGFRVVNGEKVRVYKSNGEVVRV